MQSPVTQSIPALPHNGFDRNRNGVITKAKMTALVSERLMVQQNRAIAT